MNTLDTTLTAKGRQHERIGCRRVPSLDSRGPVVLTDFGKNIRVGKDVFINHCCEFMDRGGITLEDKVLIGPKVNLITINHPGEPSRRRSTYGIKILKN